MFIGNTSAAAASTDDLPVTSTRLCAPANTSAIDITGIKGIHRTPNGLTPNDITLDDPRNIAPATDILWRTAQDMLATMPEDQILVIVVSEAHNMPTTKLPQIDILSRLNAYQKEASDDPARKFIFADEQPYNDLEWMAENKYGIRILETLKGQLHKYDPDGRMVLKANLSNNRFKMAPQSKARVFNYALSNNIPTLFNDTGKIDGKILDPADPVAARIAREEFGIDLAKEEIDVHPLNGETRGMDIRNAVMVERALAYARKTGARIIVQQCGMAHMYGDKTENLSYQNSLIDLYNRAGCKTTGLFFSIESYGYTAENMIPDEALIDNPHTIIIRGAGENEFYQGQTQAELAYIKTLAERYNGVVQCPFGQKPKTNIISRIFNYFKAKNGIKSFISTAAALKPER